MENSNKDDIIFCNNEFVCGIFSVMTGRATSTAMLKEVKPYKIFDQIAVSKIIIWIKKPEEVDFDKPTDEQLISVVKEYNLKEIQDSEIAYIYENPKATAQKITSKPLLSNGLLFSILFLLIGLIAWDIRKRQGG
ncbi:MAG: hypothetical protein FJZ11_03425 [Candidatus Omnitrophica bacterium]|nr:hypothetical protein [Candidatus Omnitrophota bacterium]